MPHSASTRGVQKKDNSAYQMAMISKSREDHGDRMTTKERRAAEDKERRDDEAGAGVHHIAHSIRSIPLHSLSCCISA